MCHHYSGPLLPGDFVDGLGHNLQTRVDKSAAGSGGAFSWILASKGSGRRWIARRFNAEVAPKTMKPLRRQDGIKGKDGCKDVSFLPSYNFIFVAPSMLIIICFRFSGST